MPWASGNGAWRSLIRCYRFFLVIINHSFLENQRVCREFLQHLKERGLKQAKFELNSIRKELSLINQSAVNSLDEGFEETLTLHRLGVFKHLGISLKTTNCIESLNSQWGQYTRRVSYWKNSNQRQRWVATALLEIEPSLRKIKGYQYLPLLRQAMKRVGEKQILAKVA